MKKIVFLFLLCALGAYGEKKPDSKWLDQKFSMFIHWGIYSELGGVWEGKPITQGYSEQIQSQAVFLEIGMLRWQIGFIPFAGMLILL